MVQIHPTAIIDDNAQIADSVKIGPYCVVGAHVVLGDNVELKSHVVVEGHTQVGAGTVIYPFASIGHAPQDLKFRGEASRLIIGENNTIREHVTMNPGTQDGAMETVIGNNNLFMMATHVAHDCIIGNNVIMANNATLGGHVEVGNNVLVGGLSAVHQFVKIGDFAVIGGMSGVESDVIPYGRVKGERAFLAGLNIVGLERGGFSKDQIKQIQRAYGELFNGAGTLNERIDQVGATYQDHQEINKIIAFAKADRHFALCQPQKK
ncbi:MAG: acyl-ACP--UDP-N-acetylglucosamine O-acyltransferase [Pseudomonadota bacterium]|jgi:UDP-N-acetylglucosamine acyltransferase|nr:acyl-[acyl-carrier-protein]--UDP-N-acetylglucosamine O-acyltransferase [Alphaproteobacteria bacterium]MEC7701125.1 acyl-ACP--UDP-N-acetylglucosamine O-acyltransferase [Pseudomonadota bacterium]MED5422729.1 acyl-ACP--UDP-N-acetylglucosamine O-acyltransferase [Pseudomonadota bacterium]|tara:strand:- start:64713 stop:65504 length:792 start_codon:yes stop_codon:yes gene_type:complete